MDEGLGKRRVHHLVGLACRGFDEIAEDVVVFHFQRGDAAEFLILGLHAKDNGAPLVPQLPRLIQRRVIPLRRKPAVAGQ